MKKVATIILNRNLPEETNKLYEHLDKYDGNLTDIFVVEAGSDKDKLSKYKTWYADWPDAKENGLRYARGMNFGISNLIKEDKYSLYDYFFLITNDTEFDEKPSISSLLNIMKIHKRLAILSPCSKRWGEKYLLDSPNHTKYFWFIHNTAYFIRREFIDLIKPKENTNFLNIFFDGTNFRGYGLESEIIAKAYINNWAAAITTEVYIKENESYLLNKADLIKTDSYSRNLKLYLEEGKKWMMQKYGFNSKWIMQLYVKNFYDSFFEFNPEYSKYKI